MSDCCDSKDSKFTGVVSQGLSRRALLKRMAASAGGIAALSTLPAYQAYGKGEPIKLAFCSQLLCVIPYEVTRAAGFFADQGLDVQLIYSRGGSAALQALNSGVVDYAATSFDAAMNAYAHGAALVRFATTGQLPLFALATSPKTADSITSIKDLVGKRIGVAQLGNSDHALTLALLKYNNIDVNSVEFANLGPNLYDALRVGQVDAGMVQEPGLTLLVEKNARVLANLMDLDDAKKYLGGPYTFMGVSVRPEEVDARREQMVKMGKALENGLHYMQTAPIDDLLDALPAELVAGGDFKVLAKVLEKHRNSLYPETVKLNRQADQRVMDTHLLAGIQDHQLDLDKLTNASILG